MMPVILLGSIYSGITTPTEAAAMAEYAYQKGWRHPYLLIGRGRATRVGHVSTLPPRSRFRLLPRSPGHAGASFRPSSRASVPPVSMSGRGRGRCGRSR
jgi:hypothetical protein